MSENEQHNELADLVGQVVALEHMIVTLVKLLGPDVRRRVVDILAASPTPRIVHSLQATECLSETLARIRLDLEEIGFGNDEI